MSDGVVNLLGEAASPILGPSLDIVGGKLAREGTRGCDDAGFEDLGRHGDEAEDIRT